MKVTLRSFGGLAGGLGRPAFVVDSTELAEHDRAELQRLVTAAVAGSSAQPGPAAESFPDAQTYEITIEDAGAPVVLEATDGNVPAEFAQLRDWLRHHQTAS